MRVGFNFIYTGSQATLRSQAVVGVVSNNITRDYLEIVGDNTNNGGNGGLAFS
jgi:hypothetical protein